MAKRVSTKLAAAEACELVAEIKGYEQSYYISENRFYRQAASDEALIEIDGRIVHITPRYKQHLYQAIEITFACATSYDARERTRLSDKPFLLPMNLRKARRGFMAYLPATAFWAIPSMIDGGRLTHIEARFNPPRYGSGDMLGVYLMSEAKFTGLIAVPREPPDP